ncbi:PD40 domain-containing protein [Archangium violaceum]|uniref:nSTAND1 domain-containing NTPase n=1 Tax=Archangium violaceum TaxID=83451 RepID=UPI0019518FEF|nr:LpqB family beta-propeller domain-containing protein [Archangium violaceum]QRN92926.1 PD40 domain-containing protein [Archangium violaceum]
MMLAPATGNGILLNPFPGPQPYRTTDRDRFFGREEMTQRLVSHLLAYSCTTLSGPSGAGKSSLVRAGAIPVLEEEHEHRTVIIDGWPADKEPLDWLVESMCDQLDLEGSRHGQEALDEAVRQAFLGSEQTILLYLDQLEQLFFPLRDPKKVDVLLERLAALTRQSAPNVRLLLALREDYLGPFRERARGHRVLLEHGFRLGPLTVAEMQNVACRAAAAGRPALTWAPEQMRELILQVRTPGQEKSPEAEVQATYAQIVCRALWEEEVRGGDQVVLIEAAPILNRYLEFTLDELGPLRADAERLLEERLIDENGGRTLLMENQARAALPASSAQQVLAHLEKARVLHAEEHQGSRYFELGHDWLAKKVLQLKRERLRWEWELARQQRQEAERRRREEAEARRKLQEHQERRQREEEEKRRLKEEADRRLRGEAERRRRLQLIATTASTAALVLCTLLVWIWMQTKVSDQARQDALAQAGRTHELFLLAGARELVSRNQPALASKLLLESDRPADIPGWMELTYELLAAYPPELTLGGLQALSATFSPDGSYLVTASEDGTARVWSAGGSGPIVVLRGHEGPIHSVTFSPDGRRIVTASEDGTARVWNADGSGAPVVLRGHERGVTSAAFSPDGLRIVTASEDGTVRVWSAGGSEPPRVIQGHEGIVHSAAFSPDGQSIVTASEDGMSRVWRVSDSRPHQELRGHEWSVHSAAFSPDGRRIVTASWDGTARVWSTDDSVAPVVLQGHGGWVVSAAFSPDGRRIVTASEDGTARVWNADGTGAPVVLQGYGGSVRTAAFSPDGQRVVTTSRDGAVRVWSIEGPRLPLRLQGHTGRVVSAAFSPVGGRVITASEDGTARVWRTDGAEPLAVIQGHEGKVYSAAFSPDGQRVVIVSEGTARVRRANNEGTPEVELRSQEGRILSAAFSPDGQSIVTGCEDGAARVWSADGSGHPVTLRGHEGRVTSAAFSPDGQRIVTASEDGTARVWHTNGEGPQVMLQGHEGRVTSAAFSPDGQRIVTASRDGTARVWSADGVGTGVVLQGHEAGVYSAAFSPDGRRIVTASEDGTVRIWSTDSAGTPVVLRVHGGVVYSAAFSPDGQSLVTASEDGVARIWTLSIPVLQQALRKVSTDCLPIGLRRTYLDEDDTKARRQYEACEQSYGRRPFSRQTP